MSVCACVCLAQLNYQRITYLKCLSFLWLEAGSFSETGKSLIVIVYFECLRGPSMSLLFTPVDSHWRECVAAAKKLGKRERMFEYDVFIENTRLVRGSKRRMKIYLRT